LRVATNKTSIQISPLDSEGVVLGIGMLAVAFGVFRKGQAAAQCHGREISVVHVCCGCGNIITFLCSLSGRKARDIFPTPYRCTVRRACSQMVLLYSASSKPVKLNSSAFLISPQMVLKKGKEFI